MERLNGGPQFLKTGCIVDGTTLATLGWWIQSLIRTILMATANWQSNSQNRFSNKLLPGLL